MKNIFGILLTVSIFLSACEHDSEKNTDFSLTDHLPITALALDGNEGLWVGSDSGLFKRTATGYQKIDLGGNDSITALYYVNENNVLWVGTRSGLYKSELSNGGMHPARVDDSNLNSSNIHCFYSDSSLNNWIGTEMGIARNYEDVWQKEKFKKNLSGTITALPFEGIAINSIASYDGDYFFATNGIRLYRTTGWNENIDAFSGATQWESPYNGASISDTMFVVFIDSQLRIWMGGKEGVQVHEGHDPKTLNTSFSDELVNTRVHCIAESPWGDIWFGTENGISVFKETVWNTPEFVLPNPFVTAIVFQKSGKVFVGTKSGLVVK